TDLRWLLRRGSPLPISNREVKPACADGTAVMWESMSLPFLVESLFRKKQAFLFLSGAACPLGRSAAFFSGKPVSFETGFLVFIPAGRPEAHWASSS
ncbi:MAG: hypothetical protein RL427_1213, partial [Bacteroidota bacterium]